MNGMNPRLFTFVGGTSGKWTVTHIRAVAGETLPPVERVEILNESVPVLPPGAAWCLRGVTSNERYVTQAEKSELIPKQVALDRPQATLAALIPIRKCAEWWTLTQDQRREIFEERSHHVKIGLRYVQSIARRLHHCRDLSVSEPFDFLTLFDFAPADSAAFDDMLSELRASLEWKFVEREVDIRLVRTAI